MNDSINTALSHRTSPSVTLYVQGLVLVLATLLLCWPLFENALFIPDDYRYLKVLQGFDEHGLSTLVDAMVIENRWDDNWWIADGAFVRFFRPLVILSYAFDYSLWGLNPTGFVATNILLHLLAIFLAWGCFRRIIGCDKAAFMGALCFAAHSCHLENIYYIAGRTDTIAGITFFLSIYIYTIARERGLLWKVLALAVFFIALLAKEYNVLLPLFFLLLDLWHPEALQTQKSFRVRLRGKWGFYCACIALLVCYWLLRNLALGEGGAGTKPFPYFFMPERDGFVGRTVAVWLQYCAGLASGFFVNSFLSDPDVFYARIGLVELLFAIAWIPFVCFLGFWHRTSRWFTVLFLCSLLPLLPLYSTSRYLYIPSFAYVALIGLGWAHFRNRKTIFAKVAIIFLLISQLILPALGLFSRSHTLPLHLQDPVMHPKKIATTFFDAQFPTANDAPLYIFEFPYDWLTLQFIDPVLEVLKGQKLPAVTVLTRAFVTAKREELKIVQIDTHTLELSRQKLPLHIRDPFRDFDERATNPGEIIVEQGFKVQIVEVEDGHAAKIFVHFPRPISELNFGIFAQDDDGLWQLSPMKFK
ncbi:hypothetical protein OAO01_01650 [Oligoflexia bacterium]|nr:hypothetical protein [Oligoflexia bacterium]